MYTAQRNKEKELFLQAVYTIISLSSIFVFTIQAGRYELPSNGDFLAFVHSVQLFVDDVYNSCAHILCSVDELNTYRSKKGLFVLPF